MKHRCPICKKKVKMPLHLGKQPEQAKFFPFCSERCRLIDLGAWLGADYRITSDLQSQDSDRP